MADTQFNELDKVEWRELARKLQAALTDEEFERDWAEFVRLKKQKALH